MSIVDHRRLTNGRLKLDVEGLRRGFYSDKYFENVVTILEGLRASGYTFAGHSTRPLPVDVSGVAVGDLVVEAQIFNRRSPFALMAGVDAALAMLRYATGYYNGEIFVETWKELNVTAVEDGVITGYEGNPENVQTVIEIRGRYRDFALLETTILGILTRASRIATNVYSVLEISNGKPLMFFPARFDLPDVQAVDGYAYWLAVQCHNKTSGHNISPLVSTDAQASWWGGVGGGTVPHALIACFMGDIGETMLAFARYIPVETPRIALVDFDNDCVGASLAAVNAYWPHYRAALQFGDHEDQQRWTLYGVRLDTSANVQDVSLAPDDPTGVNPKLVRLVREALDNAWQAWDVPGDLLDAAKAYCRSVKIVVSGGFNRDRIQEYEQAGVPVDVYAVGSSTLRNDPQTNTDFTMDVVRLWIDGQWVDMAKVGRQPCDNKDLQPVDLSEL
jgi:nicotinate phosphoribosyltransferase